MQVITNSHEKTTLRAACGDCDEIVGYIAGGAWEETVLCVQPIKEVMLKFFRKYFGMWRLFLWAKICMENQNKYMKKHIKEHKMINKRR